MCVTNQTSLLVMSTQRHFVRVNEPKGNLIGVKIAHVIPRPHTAKPPHKFEKLVLDCFFPPSSILPKNTFFVFVLRNRERLWIVTTTTTTTTKETKTLGVGE